MTARWLVFWLQSMKCITESDTMNIITWKCLNCGTQTSKTEVEERKCPCCSGTHLFVLDITRTSKLSGRKEKIKLH